MTEPAAWGDWTLPEGWTPRYIGRCRSCLAEILWCITPAGRKAPVDPDGRSHFATCPHADEWRRAERAAGRDGLERGSAEQGASGRVSRLSRGS